MNFATSRPAMENPASGTYTVHGVWETNSVRIKKFCTFGFKLNANKFQTLYIQ